MNSNIDMPSGQVFETLCDEYKFYTKRLDFKYPVSSNNKSENNVQKALCQTNAMIAMDFNMTEVSFTWL